MSENIKLVQNGQNDQPVQTKPLQMSQNGKLVQMNENGKLVYMSENVKLV